MSIRTRAQAALKERRRSQSKQILGRHFRGRRYRGNTFGAAGPCLRYTANERTQWAQDNGFAPK